MNDRLYKRIWRVTAFRTTTKESYFTRLSRALEITDLRVQFTVEKNLNKEPNTATVTVSNCSRNSRTFLTNKPIIVMLEAGYDGLTRHLFTGNLRWGQNTHQGTDWETELQLADGDRAYREARISRSYKPGTSIMVAIRDCVRSLGLDMPPNVASLASPELQNEFAVGASLSGPTQEELTKLLSPYGYRWSIQNGKMTILKDGETLPDQALVLTSPPDGGIIGSPEYTAPSNNGQPPMLTVRHMLNPSISPGGKIQVRTRFVRGNFVVQKVTHSGDSHGDDWTTELEARPL